MTRDEAFAVLGLPPTASDAEIRETHHRLMINQARDILLGA